MRIQEPQANKQTRKQPTQQFSVPVKKRFSELNKIINELEIVKM
jgi:hypothetical protein